MATERPLPKPTPETAHFWEGTKQEQLILQRCSQCDEAYFPPRPFCPACASRDVETVAASGQAILYSYVINQRPGRGFDGPVAIAVVELAEGPRMMTNIVECPQTEEALVLDMDLEVTFEAMTDEITLPFFKPAGAAS